MILKTIKIYLLFKKQASAVVLFSMLGIFSFAQNKIIPAAADTFPVTQNLGEVVVTASRVSERLLSAPVSTSKLTGEQIAQTASPSFFEAIGNMKGVHMITPSLGFKIINTRGFSNTTNVRFVQMIDNIDNQSPHIGAPIGNSLCPGDIDIDNVEIIQGVATALYGMNATNGLVNFKTKDPFTTQGFTIRQQIGVNHISDPDGETPHLFNETNARWAKAFSSKLAFKINAGLTQGYDWIANNKYDLSSSLNAGVGFNGGPSNPAYDPINGYGNESSDQKNISLKDGKTYTVARTGYWEKDVTDYHLKNWKGDASVYYRPTVNSEISYTYRTAFLNTIYQRSNRFRLENYLLQQNIFQFKNPYLQLRAYVNSENTGDSYNLRSMAENIDAFGSGTTNNTTQWFNNYTTAFNNAYTAGSNAAAAHALARAAADAQAKRLQPGTAAFNNALQKLQEINNWDSGAALHVKANLIHTEGNIDIGKLLHSKYNIQIGGDYRDYIIVPDGNYFVNPANAGGNINYTSSGFFIHASQNFFHEKLMLSAALRMVNNKYFDTKYNPRLTAVYALSKAHFIRFSYQNGYRFPSIFEGYSNINSGGVKRIGGLRVMSESKHVFENSWFKSSITAFQNAVKADLNNGMAQTAAIQKEAGLLKKNTYTYLKPEQMHSFEIGYRGTFFHNSLFIDFDCYYNFYSNFIAQVETSVPHLGSGSSADANWPADSLYNKANQDRYRLWTNSKTVVNNYGAELELKYTMNKHYLITGNVSYQTLKRTDQNDGLEDGFNTPTWISNLSLSGVNVYKNLSFNINCKYLSSYIYQSFLTNMSLPSPAVFNVDAQIKYMFVKPFIEIKIGATNILNQYYRSILDGPQIGGYYYTTLTYTLPSSSHK
ncbi:MAG TPA: TonB-dependent receptor [Chitinophagaceae bacterium]|nr:TonB-dependent receptor [Chitinophagaceae bacterium]